MEVKRNKSTDKGIKKVMMSIKYSLAGLKYAYGNERSMYLFTGLAIIPIILGLIFGITPYQWIATLLSLGAILVIELVNTAIEAVVDMVTIEYNELAKIAKDCGSAATFVASIIAVIIALVIFVPRFIALF